ncbi:MAG: hypothetical protein FWH57_04600 [Oscillospiraceae bacterium]|nr:hypothetical protein [Oscillospiraceae bacterium]
MKNLVEFIAEPSTWFTALVIVEIVLMVILCKYWGVGSSFSLGRMLGCIGVCLSMIPVTFLAFVLLSNNTYRTSKVDFSPFSELNSEQIDRFEDAIDIFLNYDFIKSYTIDENEKDKDLRKTYNISWCRLEPHEVLNISIKFFRDEQGAINRIHRYRNNDKRHTYIKNDNNTEAVLFDSRMMKSACSFYFPDSGRYLDSSIRIGNAVIVLSEHPKYYNLDKNVSSKFIRLICELMSN